ncbi:MAG TPA: hypothetical protein PK867_16645, partial [Pirellulales bacterium]|nr:hypothetical protein [Pirellulales bacterium]
VNAGTIRVFDPLQDDPRRPDIEKAVLKLLKRRLQIEPQQLTKEQPRATLYRWLMWMHRAVVAGHATGVGVEMPKETIDRVARERNADAKRAGLPPEVEA